MGIRIVRGRSSWLDGDVDLGWVLLALAAAASALLAVTYIVWTAPALLAEVLVDAVIVSAVSKRLGSIERRAYWTATAIRRTWLPAAIMIATLALAGWALQKAAHPKPSPSGRRSRPFSSDRYGRTPEPPNRRTTARLRQGPGGNYRATELAMNPTGSPLFIAGVPTT